MADRVGNHLAEGRLTRQVALWWHEAEAAIRSEQLPRARRFLRWILSCCPEDEEAWLWLSRLASSQQARLAYLRQAYAFHPDSARVQGALRQARNQQLESAVGELKPGRSPLRCFPDERYLGHGEMPNRNGGRDRTLAPKTGPSHSTRV